MARSLFASRSTVDAVDPASVLDRIVAEALLMIERADGASIEARDGEMLEYVSGAGALQPFVGLRLRIDSSLSGRCLTLDQIVRCDDALDDDRVDPEAVRRTGIRAMVCVPLRVSGRTDAVLKISSTTPDAFTDRDAADLQRLAEVLSIAVTTAADLSRVSEERLAIAEQLVRLGEAEQRRLAIALHDDPVQRLTAASYELAALRHDVPVERVAALDRAERQVRSAVTSLRALMFELAPPDLDPAKIVEVLEEAAEELFASTACELHIDVSCDRVLDLREAQLLYRIVIEALGNTRRHAQAHRVSVRGRIGVERIELEVEDDGRGFDVERTTPGHMGLSSLRERARLLGGSVSIESAPGSGARITLQVPPPLDH